ncbi:MAG: peptidoglycan editing factor PgeF [Victivallales bacterium]|nr:peptidoglycan editing factor PgeF [Eubacteriales bacterium]
MPGDFILHEKPIPYFTSSLFDSYGVKHCFTTKHGGVSTGFFKSLNFAAGNGSTRDTAENLYKNHDTAAHLLGLTADDVCRTYQAHTDMIEIVGKSRRGTGLTKPAFSHRADGLITNEEGVALSARAADCVPILLYDTKTDTAGAVHSGWQGTKKQIAVKAVKLFESLGSKPENIIAALGPCIKGCCYEVGGEFYDHFSSNPEAFSVREGKIYFDLTSVITKALINCGIIKENIQVCPLCTCCESELFFSYRRQGNDRGTMAAFITVRRKIT